jgi:hypothetical protein
LAVLRLAAAAGVLLPLAVMAAEPPTEVVIQDHHFTPSDIHVKAGETWALLIRNQDATAEEFDSAALKIEKVVAPHGQAVVHVRALKPGTYPFVGEYHEDTARGRVIAE